jgi:hypothetical protein
MLQSKRNSIEGPPNKIVGVVYFLVGIVALCVAAFVLFYQGSLTGPPSTFRTGFGIIIALYGAFRIVTGISTVRKADAVKNPSVISGRGTIPPSKPPVE